MIVNVPKCYLTKAQFVDVGIVSVVGIIQNPLLIIGLGTIVETNSPNECISTNDSQLLCQLGFTFNRSDRISRGSVNLPFV